MKTIGTAYFSKIKAIIGCIFILVSISLFTTIWIKKIPIFSSNSENLLIIIDQSLSMAIEDTLELTSKKLLSRLDVAKSLILNRNQKNKAGGIIAYSKNPTLLLPLGQSNQFFRESILSIVPTRENGGSDLGSALIFAKNLYGKKELRVEIYTDGGNTSGNEMPKLPNNWNITIFGIGSQAGGKIPLGYNAQGVRLYKYYSGSEITIPYNVSTIQKLAETEDFQLHRIDTTIETKGNSINARQIENRLYILALIFCIFGFVIQPYGKKQYHI